MGNRSRLRVVGARRRLTTLARDFHPTGTFSVLQLLPPLFLAPPPLSFLAALRKEKEVEKANRRPMNRPNDRPNQKGGGFGVQKSPLRTTHKSKEKTSEW